ncbi:MAG: two-component regulator propeller domain-containing protein, partial [Christiangramia sp.]|nr:two-component regulator propeller domain-containing protein [Christiangramia sp.]
MGHFKFRVLFSVLFILGITGKLIGQNTNSVKRVEAVEPFIKADQVHIQQNFGDDLWITTPVKVMRYNSIEVYDYNKYRGVPKEIGKEFKFTYTDSENKVWLAGNRGLAIFDQDADSFQFVSDITGNIYAVKEDAGKQLWVAAENGIFKLKIDEDKKDFGISRFLSENTLAADIILFQDKVIFGGPNGILTIDRRSGKFNKIDMGYYQDLHISSMLALEDKILIGTQVKGLFKLNSDFKNVEKLRSIPWEISQNDITDLESFNDEVIVATKGAGLLSLDKDLNLIEQEIDYPENIYDFHLNSQNLLWLVAKEGLFLHNFSGYAVKKLKHDPAKYSSLSDDFVVAAREDSEGNIWFGTGKGLSIWNTGTDRWRHIKNLNYRHGMNKPDEITGLAPLGPHMWVATANDGVYKINIHTLKRAHYSVDALNKTGIQDASTLFIDAQSNVWVGGEEAYLTRISPNDQIKDYPIKNVKAIAELGPKKIIVATDSRVHSLDPYSGRTTDLEKLNAG